MYQYNTKFYIIYTSLLSHANLLFRDSDFQQLYSNQPRLFSGSAVVHQACPRRRLLTKIYDGVLPPRKPAPGGRTSRIQPAVDRPSSTGHSRDHLSLYSDIRDRAAQADTPVRARTLILTRLTNLRAICRIKHLRTPYLCTYVGFDKPANDSEALKALTVESERRDLNPRQLK